MSKQWTEEQTAAMTVQGCNLLVSAAAGAGKTAVLVERIILMLCEKDQPADIDRLLVVTFTEAAAAEMRERIGTALEHEIHAGGRQGLARQLALLNGAPISTLHSFCLDVIRRYFYLLELDPSFRVADEKEAVLLQQEVLDEVLEEALSAGEEAFLALAARFAGSKGDAGLGSQILRLYRFAWSNPDPAGWLNRAAMVYSRAAEGGGETALESWLPPLRRQLKMAADSARMLLQQARSLLALPMAPLQYESTLDDELEQATLLSGLAEQPWPTLREHWLGVTFRRLPGAKGADEDIKKAVQNLRNQAKKEIGGTAEAYFTRDLGDFLEEIRQQAPPVTALTSITRRFAAAYSRRKRQSGLVDFSDLEHYCLQILAEGNPAERIPSAAARELQERFLQVLVDEYQDINPVQDAILTLVSRQDNPQPNLFMVGDVKQSIYRFRLGDPALFMERYARYAAEPSGRERRVLLRRNFRCREGVVAAVNYIFRQLMSRSAAEIEYDHDAELVCGAHYPQLQEGFPATGPVELHLLEREESTTETEDEQAEDLDALEREGAVVAQQILGMLGDGQNPCWILDKETGRYRPAGYRDMVILLRATSGRANRLADVLARFGIPAHADMNSGYFTATEVETMLALLQIVDNPCQDIPLAAVLRSPLAGFSMGELAAIRLHGGKNGDFYQAVVAAAAADIPELSGRLQEFLARLDRWRTLARREKLAWFISEIYRESGYADYVAGLPDGPQRQANLRALFARARQFDRFSRQGLYRFLEFVAQLRRSGDDLGKAGALGENEDVVRIMSIHKSKGLEFPVVFLCDLGKRFQFQDLQGDILIHRHLGLALLAERPEEKLRYPTLPYLSLQLSGLAETRAEEMRILYVALTRAREKLVLVGSLRGLEKERENWRRVLTWPDLQLPAAELDRCRCYLDWLGRALIRHPDITALAGEQGEERSRFMLRIHQREDLLPPASPAGDTDMETCRQALLALQPLPDQASEEERAQIGAPLHFRYPHRQNPLPGKMSVTELKRLYEDPDPDEAERIQPVSWSRPSFIQQQDGPTAAERGSLYHRVMQHLDLYSPLDAEGMTGQIQSLIRQGILSEDQARQLRSASIARFFRSEAGRIALVNRERVYREWPFTVILPDPSGEGTLVQGIVDMLVETEAGFVLVDFKTDKMPPGGPAELVNRYRGQLGHYAMAVESILGKPVCRAYLYALLSGDCIPVLMND
jgi:ATP-dependent helicase/nuclease subunit A